MILHLKNIHPHHRLSRLYLEKRIRKILRHLNLAEAELGVMFVTDRSIAHLNKKYLYKKGPTDVLSFPLNDPFKKGPLLGDIVISFDTLQREARRLKKTPREQALFLVIHGLLHLLGYDHVKVRDWKKMRKKEEELLRLVQKT